MADPTPDTAPSSGQDRVTTTAAPTPAEVRAEAQERAFWLRTLRDLVTYHGDRPWSDKDYATGADVLVLAAKARNV